MSAQDPSRSDRERLEALTRQLGDLERQSAGLMAAIDRSASVRRSLTYVVLALLVIFGLLYYREGRALTEKDNVDKLMSELERRVRANEDTVMHEARTLVENTWPTVSKAFFEQFEKDMPTFMQKVEQERDTLALNLQRQLVIDVQSHYDRALIEHSAILEQEFPEVKDPKVMQQMVDHLKEAFNHLAQKYYGEKLAAELNILYQTYDDFPMAERTADPEQLADQIYLHLIELARIKMTRLSEETDRVKPSSRAGGA